MASSHPVCHGWVRLECSGDPGSAYDGTLVLSV